MYPVISFTADTEFLGKKDEFLSIGSNKQKLIWFRKMDCLVMNAQGDADVDTVKAAVETSRLHTTTLIGEDTDLLILLLHYVKPRCKSLYFRSDKTTGKAKVYNINYLKEMIGNDLCSQLLFIHAMTGCDTTSRIFGVGKECFP